MYSGLAFLEVNEFLPRALNQYGDGLENGEIIQVADSNYPLTVKFAANVTIGCSLANVTM